MVEFRHESWLTLNLDLVSSNVKYFIFCNFIKYIMTGKQVFPCSIIQSHNF